MGCVTPSDDICHDMAAVGRAATAPVPARCDNGDVGDQQSDPRVGTARFRRFTWVTLVGTTVFFLVDVVGGWVADADPPLAARVVGGAALVVAVVAVGVLVARRLSLAGLSAQDGLPVRWLAAGAGAAAVLGALMLADAEYERWAYAPVTMAAIAATLLPPARRWAPIVGTAAGGSVLAGLVAWASGDELVEALADPLVLATVVSGATLGMLWSWDVADRLDAARRLAADVAVKDERLRFAAELHDIQGHHLQVIALKAELAARLVERDSAHAAVEMEEVRRRAADAMQDTRALVQGYRRTTLADEIANATRVLAAAGIDTTMTVSDDGAAGPYLLGLVVREATTNVLRHSRARHAHVDYRVADGSARLWIRNDGVAAVSAAHDAAGTGLQSLAERLAAAGGELTWTRDGDRFEIAASLPLPDSTGQLR
jgi:two-component system sensor histidine kinase DesK